MKLFMGYWIASTLLLCMGTPVGGADEVWRAGRSNKAFVLDHAIVEALAVKMGATLTISESPFARRLSSLSRGKIDITAGLSKTPERERTIYFLEPPYKRFDTKHFILRRTDPRPLLVYDDLYQFRIGVSIKSLYFPRFDQDAAIVRVQVPGNIDCIQLLMASRLDICIESAIGAEMVERDPSFNERLRLAPYQVVEPNPLYIGISRHSALMQKVPELEKALAQMLASGEMDAVIARFYQLIRMPAPRYK